MKKTITFLLAAMIFLSVMMILPPRTAKAANYDIDFDTACKSIYLENLDTGISVYQKEENARRYPASTTKIMTYIITVESVDDIKNTSVTVKNSVLQELENTGSSVAGLKAKEQLSVYQLLHCLMIPSGNDAALVLADYVGNGDVSRFVDKMNRKAEELGCKNTHFNNPHGLSDPNHYTTVSDMAKITKYAMTLPYFLDITNTSYSDCLGEDRYLITTNYMIDASRGGDYYYEYAKGIKTGSTGNDSGYCLVSTASKDGYTYLCVAYGAPYEDEHGEQYENGAMQDSKKLYEWAFDNLEIKTIIDKNELVKEVDLNYAWNKDSIQLSPLSSYSTILPADVDISSIDKTFDLPNSVNAPIKEGDKVGTVTLSYADQKLVTMDLIASETVDRSELLSAIDGIKTLVTSTWFIVALIVIAILFVIYLIIVRY
ncbi:MAG: D-alanyl-D-alanine carboxypeptidase, partial [Clostridia bacterium]|nr:D-alanyl-D-alanine carboxypeptidase [Clostridia bacterium]